jgi:adenosylhomocysteine nucleosidase
MANAIGLIAAMPLESRALLRLVRDAKRTDIKKLSIDIFTVSSLSCVLVTSGMGMRRAGEATSYLVENFSLDQLISFGIAGAVEQELDIGDVVLADRFCQLDQGSPGKIIQLAVWPEAARESMRQQLAGHGKKLFNGTAVTTTGTQVSGEQLPGINHPVLEMETAGIARVATEIGIPFLSLRAISDGPRAPIPIDLSTALDDDANLKVGELFKAILRNPRIIIQSRRMLRNTAIAADHAALALYTTLKHWNG